MTHDEPLLDITEHKQCFATYSAHYLQQNDCLPLRLKQDHTYKVLELAERVVWNESPGQKLTGPTARAVLLAALYHDIGRFSQYTRWKTFSDSRSTNHGTLAVRILKEQGFLDGETPHVRRLVLVAVGLHNKYRLPPHMDDEQLRVTLAVRDADKVDIFRIMAIHLNGVARSQEVVLHVKDEPDKWSPGIVETVLSGRVPSYADLQYINDFRMLLVSWLHELHYATSRLYLAHSGHVEEVLAGLPQDLAPVSDVLRALLDKAKQETVHER